MIIREEKETRLETRKIVFLDVIKVLRNNFNKFAAYRNQSYFYELWGIIEIKKPIYNIKLNTSQSI